MDRRQGAFPGLGCGLDSGLGRWNGPSFLLGTASRVEIPAGGVRIPVRGVVRLACGVVGMRAGGLGNGGGVLGLRRRRSGLAGGVLGLRGGDGGLGSRVSRWGGRWGRRRFRTGHGRGGG